MSADRWGVCPKCEKIRLARIEVSEKNVEESYGKVKPEEYIRLLAELESTEAPTTLREDYEIWTNEYGVFEVSYSCSCHVCGFSFKYNHSEMIGQ